MYRLRIASVCVMMVLAAVQAPWQHVHVRGGERDHGILGAIHAHYIGCAGHELRWCAPGPDEDARSVGSVEGVQASPPLFCLAAQARQVSGRPAGSISTVSETTPHANSPPLGSPLRSRAPPA